MIGVDADYPDGADTTAEHDAGDGTCHNEKGRDEVAKLYGVADAHRLLELAEVAALQAQQSVETDWERAKVQALIASALAQVAAGAAAVDSRR